MDCDPVASLAGALDFNQTADVFALYRLVVREFIPDVLQRDDSFRLGWLHSVNDDPRV